MNQPELRISDADREQAVGALGEHYLAGRLTKEEYDERTAAAWAAKTASALTPLFRDLPSLQQQRAVAPTPTSSSSSSHEQGRRGRGLPVVPFVLLLVLVVFATWVPVPWWAWLVVGWMWFSGMFAGVCSRGRWRHAPGVPRRS